MPGLLARLAILGALPFALPLGACSVVAGAASSGDQAINQCQRDEDCGGAACVDRLCVAKGGTLTSVLVSVTPAFAGATYYVDYPAMGALPLGGASHLDIAVPSVVELSGSLKVDATCDPPPTFIPKEGTSLQPSNGFLPADVTFRPSRRVAGLPSEIYLGVVAPNGFTFRANLPPNDYDIYIHPYRQPTDEKGNTPCAVPPRLLLQQSVTGNVDFKLAPPSKLDVQVIWSKDASPVGWTLDLVDPATGYAIAIPRVLSDQDVTSMGERDVTYQVTLDYVPTYGPDAKGILQPLSIGTDVLRLTPPATLPGSDTPLTAPVLLAQLTGADIGNDSTAAKPPVVRQAAALPSNVTVAFDTELAGGGPPVPASITLTATELPGFPELFTSFTRTVTADASGAGASVDLLPGTYRVVATPKAACDAMPCLGTTETTWVVSAAPSTQAGRLIEFWPAAVLHGRAVVQSGEPAVGAIARAIASPSVVDTNVMNRGDAVAASLPRAAFGPVDAQGSFEMGADAGTYDFRIEPDPSTGFGWYVRPNMAIDTSASELDLDVVRLPLPVVYRGTVSAGTGDTRMPLPSALIRAFVYRTPDGRVSARPSSDAVAVQVAETRADSAGSFALLLPSTLDGK